MYSQLLLFLYDFINVDFDSEKKSTLSWLKVLEIEKENFAQKLRVWWEIKIIGLIFDHRNTRRKGWYHDDW